MSAPHHFPACWLVPAFFYGELGGCCFRLRKNYCPGCPLRMRGIAGRDRRFCRGLRDSKPRHQHFWVPVQPIGRFHFNISKILNFTVQSTFFFPPPKFPVFLNYIITQQARQLELQRPSTPYMPAPSRLNSTDVYWCVFRVVMVGSSSLYPLQAFIIYF